MALGQVLDLVRSFPVMIVLLREEGGAVSPDSSKSEGALQEEDEISKADKRRFKQMMKAFEGR